LTNPVTGQSLAFRRTTAETDGELLKVESAWRPGNHHTLLGALGPIGRVLGRPSHSAAER